MLPRRLIPLVSWDLMLIARDANILMRPGDTGVIRSYGDRETESVARRRRVRRVPEEIRRSAQRKLVILNNVPDLNDSSVPPGNRLEELSGNREGQ